MEDFLRALRETGDLIVSAEPPPELDEAVEAALREHDSLYRNELVPGAPNLVVETAHWAARKLYHACQLLTLRDAPPAVARDTLLDPYEGPRGPEVDYSVDLTFAYLPSLYQLAERVAPSDPVLDVLRELAVEWALSSVGMPDVGCPSRLTFWENPCLRSLYVDRVIEFRDVSRLEDARVADAVRAALGAYPELEPRIMETLNPS